MELTSKLGLSLASDWLGETVSVARSRAVVVLYYCVALYGLITVFFYNPVAELSAVSIHMVLVDLAAAWLNGLLTGRYVPEAFESSMLQTFGFTDSPVSITRACFVR